MLKVYKKRIYPTLRKNLDEDGRRDRKSDLQSRLHATNKQWLNNPFGAYSTATYFSYGKKAKIA